MEKRVLLAVVLSLAVLYVFQALFVRPVPKPPGGTNTAQAPAAAAPTPTSATASPPPPPEPVAEPGPAAATLLGDTEEHEVRIENQNVIAVFTNRGARLKSWRLKRYQDQAHQPFEIVTHDFGDAQPLPFSLAVPDAATTKRINSVLFAVHGAPAGDAPITTPTDLTFEYRADDGLQVVKQFRFTPSTYLVNFGATVTRGSESLAPAIQWGPGVGEAEGNAGRGAVMPRALFAVVTDVTRLSAADVGKQPTHQGDFFFAGVDDHYFMSTALTPGPSTITYQAFTIPPPSGSKDPPRELVAYTLEPGRREAGIDFYIGPKDLEILTAIDRNLSYAIDFGRFRIIVAPLLRTLNWIHGFVGNYGWSIVILTVIINVVILPLRHKQVVSMRKMQAIQPEVKAIQDRYAKFKTSDPQKQNMNKELMKLYQDRGVNPAAGCLPMLIPLPVFFAFYALLYTAIELRGAPFVGWIHDLSRPDPLYITPILMGATQFWQQWIMPAAGVDPAQQKMMMIMPLIFMFIFLTLPAGVVLYWVVNNFLAIGQQYLTNRIIGPAPVRTVRPPAERRLKRAGSGKTDAADGK